MKSRICFFLITFFTIFAFAEDNLKQLSINTNQRQDKQYGKLVNNTRQLLQIQRWDENYIFQREKDIKFLLGNIGNDSLSNLSPSQKQEVILLMQKFAIDQFKKDELFFKDYVITEYTKSFTADELQKLVNYYNTSLMQMMIEAQIQRKEIKIEEINKILEEQNPIDKSAIENYGNSYLSQRYSRFLQHLNSSLDKMIYERTKEILAAIFKSLPSIIKNVEARG